jgi:hypothetical protein
VFMNSGRTVYPDDLSQDQNWNSKTNTKWS